MHCWLNFDAINAMNFKQLSHFVALAEHRSFNRAAEACNITQPAFSRSIRSLEDELGCQLIDRHSGRNFQPTIQGERVLQHAITVLQGLDNLNAEINQSARLELGEVRLGCGPVPAASLVPRAVARFLNAYPGMQVHLDVENWEKLHRSLQREELDFAVAASLGFKSISKYDCYLLQPQRMALFCRAGHPLLDGRRLTAERLFAYAFGLAGASREQLSATARLHGVAGARLAIECDNIHTLLSVIGQSDTIGLLSAEHFEGALSAENIVRLSELPQTLDSMYARYAIIVPKGRSLSPGAERLLQLIKDTDVQLASANTTVRLAT